MRIKIDTTNSEQRFDQIHFNVSLESVLALMLL